MCTETRKYIISDVSDEIGLEKVVKMNLIRRIWRPVYFLANICVLSEPGAPVRLLSRKRAYAAVAFFLFNAVPQFSDFSPCFSVSSNTLNDVGLPGSSAVPY